MALPKGFIDLPAAYNAADGTLVNIIGVVVDLLPPRATQGTHHMFTFKLLDARLRDSVYGSSGLPVRFFKDLRDMPRVQQHGDVVLLRNIKIVSIQQQPMAVSNVQTETTVFSSAVIPEPAYQIAYQGSRRLEGIGKPIDVKRKSLEEEAYVIHLKHEIAPTVASIASGGIPAVSFEKHVPPPSAPTGPATMRKRSGEDLPSIAAPKKARHSTFGNKFKLIKELQHRNFADICAQVVKIFPTQYGTDLYVTDYTENKEMFYYTPPEAENECERDGDTFGYNAPSKRAWPGPYGHLVLKIELKEPHAGYANKEVQEGDFVLLRNVRIKATIKLEGNMWPDTLNPDRVQIIKLKKQESPEMDAILERRARYWAARKAKEPAQEGEKKKVTKTEKRKLKKQRAAEKAATAACRGGKSDHSKAIIPTGLGKNELNPHIRCGHEEVPISTIKYVLDPENERHLTTKQNVVVPFVCARYRARVRVVDFSPRQLEDFAIPELPDDGDRSENSVDMDWGLSPKYEWSFSLLLEDATTARTQKGTRNSEDLIWANLSHREAQCLFGNDVDDPADLNNDPRLLAKLREKMCILWGNLEEKGPDEAISNVSFECCLMEYGVEMDEDDPDRSEESFGFQRMYGMFGVTIM